MDIADFAAVGFVGLDMDATVGIPEAYGAVFAATQAIIAVAIEPSSQYGALVPLQHVNLLPRKIFHAHLFLLLVLHHSLRAKTLSPPSITIHHLAFSLLLFSPHPPPRYYISPLGRSPINEPIFISEYVQAGLGQNTFNG